MSQEKVNPRYYQTPDLLAGVLDEVDITADDTEGLVLEQDLRDMAKPFWEHEIGIDFRRYS